MESLQRDYDGRIQQKTSRRMMDDIAQYVTGAYTLEGRSGMIVIVT